MPGSKNPVSFITQKSIDHGEPETNRYIYILITGPASVSQGTPLKKGQKDYESLNTRKIALKQSFREMTV